MSTPAERYAESRRRSAEAKTQLGMFKAQQAFDLDEFQLEACRHLEAGKAVLVAAPTGAGKTIVGEFAVHLALAQGKKAFYTTPIKALSNQKFQELRQEYGAERVGLLTGDTSINSEADVVVMTTEVLRNMLYQDSATLAELGFVVMDEVHYLADRFRGAVWEEVIIHLPESVQLAALSATVSNAEEFGAWLDTVRGETAVVVSEHRPVPLWQHMMVDYQLHDLFVSTEQEDHAATNTLVNPELQRLAHYAQAPVSRRSGGHRGRGRGRRDQRRDYGRSNHRSGSAEVSRLSGSPRGAPRLSRPRMIRALDRDGLLPCIAFIFSRAGCEAAVEQCLHHGLQLTSRGEAAEIASRVEEMGWELPAEDLSVLGFDSFREALINGIAAHHAGMLPPFKELVENLYAEGLLKVVFATETLALGINMPARTVVLEKLDKFDGESHQDITPGEYTQLTGRAGRRGIDVEGHAVVVWQPGMDPRQVAGLASKRTYPLNSSFSPSYNMAVNLTAQFGRRRARTILESSFAQFQADRGVVGMARDVAKRESSLRGYQESMACHLGDFQEYFQLRRAVNEQQKDQAKSRNRQRRREVIRVLASLEPGDVIEVGGRRRLGHCLVVHTAPEHDPRPGVITEDGRLRNISVEDFSQPPEVTASIRLPRKPQVKVPKIRRDLASSMRSALRERTPPRKNAPQPGFGYENDDAGEQSLENLESALRKHPCHSCSDRENHARWAERWWKLHRETEQLKASIDRKTGSIAKTFDRVCGVLFDLGHLQAAEAEHVPQAAPLPEEFHAEEFLVTERGQRLRRIYGERDLFTELLMERGVLAQLSAEELAAFSTLLVYQAKREDEGAMPQMPTKKLTQAVRTALEVHTELETLEKRHHLEPTDAPELGLSLPMYYWASGASLRAALEESPLAAGDFVRWAKQCIDVLDQLSAVPTASAKFANRCQEAVDLIARGVVSYSSVAYQSVEEDQ
ncbi:DEAD/DEAH box helicase [Nesterenkonia alkaliphila]|uniref:DEAD/DEAH box helicase n=1 Tax=Nesterenkonia alkaliphila TaxID=1463631 RepID=A0A7K1UM15_9MICC|nr:DEAD/DEAH box helicase [Nesterenkonia alkaliphila]MVT27362.1 DEAD/DEAH box helicase [Nesterenkonia alkaliphila]GFZ80587.1 helicase [Nesterenkonia alkaliphila]